MYSVCPMKPLPAAYTARQRRQSGPGMQAPVRPCQAMEPNRRSIRRRECSASVLVWSATDGPGTVSEGGAGGCTRRRGVVCVNSTYCSVNWKLWSYLAISGVRYLHCARCVMKALQAFSDIENIFLCQVVTVNIRIRLRTVPAYRRAHTHAHAHVWIPPPFRHV